MRKIICIFLVLASCSREWQNPLEAILNEEQNILKNGDFEIIKANNLPDEWNISENWGSLENLIYCDDTSDAKNGVVSLRMSLTGQGIGSIRMNQKINSNEIIINKRYKVSFFLKVISMKYSSFDPLAEAVGVRLVDLNIWNVYGSWLNETKMEPSDWIEYSFETTINNADNLYLQLSVDAAGGSETLHDLDILLDDLKFIKLN